MEINTIETFKERLIDNMKKLPEPDIQEVLDFMEFLIRKRSKGTTVPHKAEIEPAKDPILKLLGIANVDPFSNKIDQELYGQ